MNSSNNILWLRRSRKSNMELSEYIFTEPYCEKVLAAINGRRTIEEIIDVSYVHKFDVCKIVALLIQQKAIAAVLVVVLFAVLAGFSAVSDFMMFDY